MVKGGEPTLTSCPLMYRGMCRLPVAHKIKVKKSNKNIKWYSSYGVIVNFTDNARNVSSLWAWHSGNILCGCFYLRRTLFWGISGCSQAEVQISNWEDSLTGLAHLSQGMHTTKGIKGIQSQALQTPLPKSLGVSWDGLKWSILTVKNGSLFSLRMAGLKKV